MDTSRSCVALELLQVPPCLSWMGMMVAFSPLPLSSRPSPEWPGHQQTPHGISYAGAAASGRRRSTGRTCIWTCSDQWAGGRRGGTSACHACPCGRGRWCSNSAWCELLWTFHLPHHWHLWHHSLSCCLCPASFWSSEPAKIKPTN